MEKRCHMERPPGRQREKMSHVTDSASWRAKRQGVTCNGFRGREGATCHIALHCFALLCIALHYFELLCLALICIAVHCVGLRCIALHCLALHSMALR